MYVHAAVELLFNNCHCFRHCTHYTNTKLNCLLLSLFLPSRIAGTLFWRHARSQYAQSTSETAFYMEIALVLTHSRMVAAIREHASFSALLLSADDGCGFLSQSSQQVAFVSTKWHALGAAAERMWRWTKSIQHTLAVPHLCHTCYRATAKVLIVIGLLAMRHTGTFISCQPCCLIHFQCLTSKGVTAVVPKSESLVYRSLIY